MGLHEGGGVAKWGTVCQSGDRVEAQDRGGEAPPTSSLRSQLFSDLEPPLRKDTEMAFRGLYEHSLDSKDRLTVPSRFRSRSPTELFSPRASTPASGCTRPPSSRSSRPLPLAPQPLRQRRAGSAPPFPRRLLRREARLGRADPHPEALDRARRPGGQCVVIGAGEYLEIWNADAWAKQEEELDAAAPEIAEGLAGATAA